VIQVHEAELVHELASKRIEAEEAEKAKIAEKLSAAEVSCSYHNLFVVFLSVTRRIYMLQRLQTFLASSVFMLRLPRVIPRL